MEDALKLGTPADKYSEDPSLTIILTELHDRAVGLLGQHPLLILQQLTGRHLQSRNVPLPYAAKYFELGRKASQPSLCVLHSLMFQFLYADVPGEGHDCRGLRELPAPLQQSPARLGRH